MWVPLLRARVEHQQRSARHKASKRLFVYCVPEVTFPMTFPLLSVGGVLESHFEHITASSAEFKKLRVLESMESPNADLGYSFPLADQCTEDLREVRDHHDLCLAFAFPSHDHHLQQGTVVGLFPEGLRLIIGADSCESFVPCAITERAYFVANKVDDESPRKTVCMIGIVPVRVVG